jgi:ABC-type Fe3+ transport system substrate-binding protein
MATKTTFAVFAFLILLLLAQAFADTVGEAKKERTLVFYGTMSAPDMVRVVKAFESKYPFLKVETFRANSERVLNKFLTEARAGSYFADVINLDGINGWVLKEKGMLQPHKSAETEAFPEAFRDPTGLLPCCIYAITNVIGYNTNLVPKQEAPKSFADLLQPKWRGQMGMDSDESEWFTGLISVWGKEKTVNYFKALAKQKLSLRRGHTLLAELTAAGEFPVAVNLFGYRVLELQKQGAPHPNAGRLFIDYVFSQEGQELVASLGRTSVRPGVKIRHPRLVKGVKLHPVKPEMGKDHAALAKLYYSIME